MNLLLPPGNLRLAVILPEGEDLNEWVAVNTVDFFNQINMLYGTITEFCTEEQCPIMSAGPKYEYHWADGQTVKKPIKCSAPKYIDYLMTWVQDQLDDENLFPSKIGEEDGWEAPILSRSITDIDSLNFRRSLSQRVHAQRQDHPEASLPGVRPHLPPAFQVRVLTYSTYVHVLSRLVVTAREFT